MSKLNCCGKAIKALFTATNTFIAILGLVAIGFGTFWAVVNEDLDYITGSSIFNGTGVIVTVGIAILIVAAFGIAAGVSEVWQLLAIYASCASGLVIVLMAGSTFTIATQDDIYQRVADKFSDDIGRYKQANDSDYSPEVNQFVDDIQLQYHCCGLNGPEDWIEKNLNYILENQGLPESCICTDSSAYSKHNTVVTAYGDECSKVTYTMENVSQYTSNSWTKGCDEPIDSMTFNEVLYLTLAVFAVLLCKVAAVGYSCRLCCLLHRYSHRQRRGSVNYYQLHNYPKDTLIGSSDQTEPTYSVSPPVYDPPGGGYSPSSHPA